MDQITLTFSQPIQVSVQIGDILYYTDDPMGTTVVKIGDVASINYSINVCYDCRNLTLIVLHAKISFEY